MKIFVPPFRIGEKQRRAVLDSNGHEIVTFPIGLEDYAIEYCKFLNEKYKNDENRK